MQPFFWLYIGDKGEVCDWLVIVVGTRICYALQVTCSLIPVNLSLKRLLLHRLYVITIMLHVSASFLVCVSTPS